MSETTHNRGTGKPRARAAGQRTARPATPRVEPKHIGITINSRHGDTLRTLRGLRDAGVDLRVHLITDPFQAKRAGQLDAVLIGGGSDIHPSLYGERNRNARNVDGRRDRLEVTLTETALSHGVPLMGICRGGQLINAVLGGTLHQDLWEDLGVEHEAAHGLSIEQDILDPVMPHYRVNSSHHQGIRDVGEGLEVLASHDDVPELLWSPGVLLTQFHPETLAVEDPRWLNLFKWWIDGARMKG